MEGGLKRRILPGFLPLCRQIWMELLTSVKYAGYQDSNWPFAFDLSDSFPVEFCMNMGYCCSPSCELLCRYAQISGKQRRRQKYLPATTRGNLDEDIQGHVIEAMGNGVRDMQHNEGCPSDSYILAKEPEARRYA